MLYGATALNGHRVSLDYVCVEKLYVFIHAEFGLLRKTFERM